MLAVEKWLSDSSRGKEKTANGCMAFNFAQK